jgi:hypothetical protein
LHLRVFDPILSSNHATAKLKQGTRLTIMRMRERDARGMVSYFWSAVVGTDPSIAFAAQLKAEGFDRFEEAIDEFRVRFDEKFLRR